MQYHFFTNGKISRWNFIPLIVLFLYYMSVVFLHDKGVYRLLLSMFCIVCLKTSVVFNLSCVLILFQKRLLQTLQLCSIFLFSLYNTAKLKSTEIKHGSIHTWREKSCEFRKAPSKVCLALHSYVGTVMIKSLHTGILGCEAAYVAGN